MTELRARLERRAEDSAATIAQRLENAKREIERWRLYDYVVVNDDLQRAYRQVVAILTAERARGARVGGGDRELRRGAAGGVRRRAATSPARSPLIGALISWAALALQFYLLLGSARRAAAGGLALRRLLHDLWQLPGRHRR